MKLKWTVALLVSTVLASNTFGQMYRDGLHAGFVTGGDIRNEGFAFGYQASREINDFLLLAVSVTRQDDELEGHIDEVPIPADFSYNLETYAIAASAQLGFLLYDRVRLYALAGAGFYVMDADGEEVRETIAASPPSPVRLAGVSVDVDNDFGLHVGAGIEIELSERWSVFVDYRHVMLEPDADLEIVEQRPTDRRGAVYERTLTEVSDTLEYEHDLVHAGFNYWF